MKFDYLLFVKSYGAYPSVRLYMYFENSFERDCAFKYVLRRISRIQCDARFFKKFDRSIGFGIYFYVEKGRLFDVLKRVQDIIRKLEGTDAKEIAERTKVFYR